MASEWTETTLGTIVEFQSGGTPSKDRAEFWGGSIPWVSAKDMKRFRLDDTEDHVTEEGAANGTKVIPVGTVLLLVRGMTLLSDVPICIANRSMTFNQDVKALRPTLIRADFLPYLLLGNKERLLSLVDLAGHGTGRLNSDELKALEILLPPEPEQRAIAHILSTLDDKIELNRRMNETLEAMARALFTSWFVDFDPARAKAEGRNPGLPESLADLFPDRFEDSELGEIPAEWEMRALYDCAEYINGLAFRNDDFSQERAGLPVIKIGELKSGITSQTKFTEANLDSKYRILSGDILFSWSGSPDTSIDTFVWTGGDGWLNQHIFKVKFYRPQEKVFVYFLLRHFKTVFVEIARNKQTTGLGHVTAQDLRRLKTVFPPNVVLQAFNRVVESLFQSAYGNSCESCTLATLRDTLLPKLISGELRVKGAERVLTDTPV